MPPEMTAEFESSLGELEVDWTQTTTDEFHEDLAKTVIRPTVGSSMSIDGISLDGTPVILNPTPAELEAAKTGVTTAEFGIASYGTIVVQDTPEGNEPVSLFPDLHVAVLRESDIVDDMPAAFMRLGSELQGDRSSVILATGPSATADMGSLVRGAHGPNDVHVLILTDQ